MKNFIFGFVVAMWAGPVLKKTVYNVASDYNRKAEDKA